MTLFHRFTKTEFQKDLNDHCWEHIFQSLSLEDQISVARTCGRFYALLFPSWQKIYQNFSVDIHTTGTFDNFAVFIKSIHGTVESMKLRDLSSEEWDIIKLYTYPNLRRFYVNDISLISDEHVLKMTEIFPNLRSFSPKGIYISGKHIEKFRYLKNLDLDYSERIKLSNLEKILEEVPLRSLRLNDIDKYSTINNVKIWKSKRAFKKFCNLTHISLWCDELKWLSDLSLFSNLKVLQYLDDADTNLVIEMLKYIVRRKHNDLVEIRAYRNLPANWLHYRSYPNLKKLTLCWRGTAGFDWMSRQMPNLREIVLNDVRQLKEDDIYLWLNSILIKFISIEGCVCEFSEFILNVERIMNRRRSLLRFNFYKNEFKGKDVTLRVVGESPLLKISENGLKTDKSFRLNLLRFR